MGNLFVFFWICWFGNALDITRTGLGLKWEDPVSCPAYICSDSLSEGVCSLSNSTTVFVRPCPYLHYCSSGICTLIPDPIQREPGLPGDPCITHSTCLSQKCINHKCAGKGFQEECKQTSECDQGFFCSSESCWPLMDKGAKGCKEDFDCENGSGCNDLGKKNMTCMGYFSVEKYTWVTDCVSYFSRLCESGTCLAPGGTGRGICIDPIQSSLTYPYIPCQSHSDCDSISDQFTFFGVCECGGNSQGDKYCTPFTGDPPGKELIVLLKEWYNSTTVQTCHALEREAPDCISQWEKGSELMNAYYAYQYSALISHSEPCAVSVLLPEYEFEWNPTSSAGVLIPFILSSVLNLVF